MSYNLKVSIIIPVYNSEKYIKKCLESVIEQTYDNYEVIVINDGSTDNSMEILREFSEKYPQKVKAINQSNMGVAKTRNKGIEMATGDYIAFIDNDDFLEKDYLQTLIENSEKGQMDIVFCGYRRPNENGKIIKELHVNGSEWSKFLITAPWAKIYKKSFIKDNEIEFLDNNIGEDIYFNLQAFLLTTKIRHVDYVGYNWFFNTKSISNSKQKDFDKINVYNLLNNCIDCLNKRDLLQPNYDYLELFFFRYVIWFLLFTCKKHTFKEISYQYNRIFSWLGKHFPNYKKSKLIGINKPEGETKQYQLFYFLFMLAHKMKCGKLLVYFYSKI